MNEKPPSGTIVLNRKKLLWGAGIAVIIIAAVTVFFVMRSHNAAGDGDAKETRHIIQLVGTHFELPDDEEPTVAKIKDKSKLSDQAFFTRAQNGDYLLVYNQYKIALIYRESSNRLINVGPINLDATKQLDGGN